jgi:hypothetical protein
MNEKIGYVYCFSNESMPGILKVGMTERKPEDRLRDSNRSNTWTPPTPYKIEMAKQVYYPKQKEQSIHRLLDIYGKRINPKREFFKSSVEEIKAIFDIIDGDYYCAKEVDIEDEKEDKEDKEDKEEKEDEIIEDEKETEYNEKNEEEDVQSVVSISLEKKDDKNSKKKKDNFYDGQRIRHTLFDNGNTWIGTFKSGKVLCNDKLYTNIYDFVKNHYKAENIQKYNKNNVFNETECEINNEWVVISIFKK